MILLGIIALVISFGLWGYFNVVKPSYLSVVSVCSDNGLEILEDAGYMVTGFFDSSSGNITIDETYADEQTIKHERIHQKQMEQGRFYGCRYPVAKFVNELEAYLFQWF